jgi:hypothetical protein
MKEDGMRMACLMAFGLVLLVSARPGLAQSKECLVEVHDVNGAVTDGGSLCQNATGTKCTFNLEFCLNQPALDGCAPVDFAAKRFRATGHCGPVGKVRVQAAGAGAVCGAMAPVTVRTRAHGARAGKCMIRAAARSGRKRTETDVDTIDLTCMPASQPCPTTTTSTTTTSTTTTTHP